MKLLWIILAVSLGLSAVAGVVTAGWFTNWKYYNARKRYSSFLQQSDSSEYTSRMQTLTVSKPPVCNKVQFFASDDATPDWLGNDGAPSSYDFFGGSNYDDLCSCAAQVCESEEDCQSFSLYRYDDNGSDKFSTAFFTEQLVPDRNSENHDTYVRK